MLQLAECLGQQIGFEPVLPTTLVGRHPEQRLTDFSSEGMGRVVMINSPGEILAVVEVV